jgi:hypothetical protein
MISKENQNFLHNRIWVYSENSLKMDHTSRPVLKVAIHVQTSQDITVEPV